MDRLECLELFLRVADSGSFTTVGQQRGLGQSSVSRKIKALEEELGAQLFLRTTRNVSLTDAGQLLYEQADEIVAQYRELESSIGASNQKLTGRLRLDAPNEFGRSHVIPHVIEFMEKHPNVTVDLSLNDHYIDLAQNGVDLALRIGNLNNSSIIAKKLGHDKRWAVASPSYLEKHGHPQCPGELTCHQCIAYAYRRMPTRWDFRNSEGQHSVTISGRFCANSGAAMREAALRGHGITILGNYAIAQDLADGKLVIVLPDYQIEPLDIQFVFLTKRHMPQSCRVFMEFFERKLKLSGAITAPSS